MIKHADHFHGSDLELIEQLYNIKKEEILSFSANVNPLGVSGRVREQLPGMLDCIESYPDRDYTALRRAISDYCGAAPESLIVGNGTSELISLFIKNKRPAKALIVGPTYSEYEREIALSGGVSHYFPLEEADEFRLNVSALKDTLREDIELLVICNPNNPTSTAVTREDMRQILDTCKRHGIFVLVDETYIEFADNCEALSAIPLIASYNNILILRGISKFFAAPGLRLGYAITGNTDLIELINSRKNPWTINSLADAAGRLMFSDRDYIRETRELVKTERDFMTEALREIPDLTVFEPTANFVLVKIGSEGLNADILFENCIREKMMIRNCATFPFLNNLFFRICFMMREDNERLLDCIKRSILSSEAESL